MQCLSFLFGQRSVNAIAWKVVLIYINMVHCGDDGKVDLRVILAGGVGFIPLASQGCKWMERYCFQQWCGWSTDVLMCGNAGCL